MNNYSCFTYTPTRRLVLVTGHFGSGKTNVALNLAYALRERGEMVTLVDFDVVNPYFRAADDVCRMKELGIRAIVPEFANTNVDVPSLPPEVYSAFESEGYVIFDVGGDSDGAVALGMYNSYITRAGYEMLYVVNKYRPLTVESGDALDLLGDICRSARLTCSGIVNNSNIGDATEDDTLYESLDYVAKISEGAALPVVFSATFERSSLKRPPGELLVMRDVTRRPWEI